MVDRAGHGCGHVVAVAQDGDPVAQIEYLGQAVGHVEHAHPVPAEPPDHGHQDFRFPDGKRGGGLIHDEEAAVAQEGAGHLDHLSLGHAQFPQRPVQLEIETEALQDGPRFAFHRSSIEQEAPADFAPHEEIVDEVEIEEGGRFLVNGRDTCTCLLRGVDIARAKRGALHPDGAAVRLDHPCEALDEG